MTAAYTEARKRGDTQGQHRAHEREKRRTHLALLSCLPRHKRAKIRRALGLSK